MPRRGDIGRILVIGSGPIVIGQAGEFDYSGTQGCRALRDDGYEVVLVNSNPATIMTDTDVADRTYVEPLDVEAVEAVIRAERPDALLPTLGGQTALNLAVALAERGILDVHGVELIGASVRAIGIAEDRERFRDAVQAAGLPVLRARVASTVEEAIGIGEEIGLPVILRPAFTLGGEGGGMAATRAELGRLAATGIAASPIGQVLVERSVAGWGEFEMEVVRDRAGNAIVVCAIENVDPMGVHTGDSVTVAPAMTLTDDELQRMRDAAIRTLAVVGVTTGGANVQFALDRVSGELAVIEMNPRVSRSSALASKATGVPIARLAARLAVGYTLDELPNEITAVTPASFEPSLDYVAVKMPRFAFEKLPGAVPVLGPAMQSVGEVLTLGRTFAEALGKALGARELDRQAVTAPTIDACLAGLEVGGPERFDLMVEAARLGADGPRLAAATGIHPWFCDQIAALGAAWRGIAGTRLESLDGARLLAARRAGLTDRDVAGALGVDEIQVVRRRAATGARPSFRAVDTCAAEFPARTPYFYAAFEGHSEAPEGQGPVVVLGSGPNRIGQGVEFDYCCVRAAGAIRALGREAVMVNCNPETVSTDHGVSDRLYLEPVTLGSVLDICAAERPAGVIAQLGGQTPLRLAAALAAEGVPILGTSPEAIDLAEDRGRFGEVLSRIGLDSPAWGLATDADDAMRVADRVGFPVMVRPSYVLGGRGMRVCDSPDDLRADLAGRGAADFPLLVDAFLDGAIEVDVDGVSDGESTWIAGVMEHIEAAGVHSGDSACAMPPQRLGPGEIGELEAQTHAIARALGVVGPINVQFALRHGRIVVLEANPRASRTVPFVAKATGTPVIDIAVRVMLGERLADLAPPPWDALGVVAVKEAVLPFKRFTAVDPLLGPEMRSTGEAMGIAGTFAEAFSRAQRGAGQRVPAGGRAFVSARDEDKAALVGIAADLTAAGFSLVATEGTARALVAAHLPVEVAPRLGAAVGDAAAEILARRIDLVVNTPSGSAERRDGAAIRRAAVRAGVPYATTIPAARAIALAAQHRRTGESERVLCLQDLHANRRQGPVMCGGERSSR